MRIILLFFILLNTCTSQSWAKGIMLYVHHGDSVKLHRQELDTEMQKMNIDVIDYPVDINRTVGEHALRIDSIVRKYRENTDSLSVFMLTDKEATFVGLDVLSKDTTIVALVTLSGAFCNGDDYFYNETSVIKNMEMLDSASFDNKKEQYLRTAYKMISKAKQGKTFKLPKGADEHMQYLFTLLNSRYGRSILEFSLDDRLKRIRSWIIPFCRGENQSQELELYVGKLIYNGVPFGVKYVYPGSYHGNGINYNIVKNISNLLKH